MGSHQLGKVGHIFIRLLQKIGQALVLLLVDELAVSLFIFSLGHTEKSMERDGIQVTF